MPRRRDELTERWRAERLGAAIVALRAHGTWMSGIQLGEALGLSPRGLRPLLVRSGSPIVVELRSDAGGRARAWYRVDPAAGVTTCRLPRVAE